MVLKAMERCAGDGENFERAQRIIVKIKKAEASGEEEQKGAR